MVVPFLSKYMKDDLHFTYSQIGWIMVCFGLCVGIFILTSIADMFRPAML